MATNDDIYREIARDLDRIRRSCAALQGHFGDPIDEALTGLGRAAGRARQSLEPQPEIEAYAQAGIEEIEDYLAAEEGGGDGS